MVCRPWLAIGPMRSSGWRPLGETEADVVVAPLVEIDGEGEIAGRRWIGGKNDERCTGLQQLQRAARLE